MNYPKWTLDADKDMLMLFLQTWGSPPKNPERIEVQKHIVDKFGWDRAYEIMYWSQLKGFHKIKTLIEQLDDKGNIKSKELKPTGRVITNDTPEMIAGDTLEENRDKIKPGWLIKSVRSKK